MFYSNPSADMLLQPSELDFDLKKRSEILVYHLILPFCKTSGCMKAKVFHYGSIGLITEPCKSAHIAAANAAKEAGVILSYDPNLRLPLWPSAESAREGILGIWDVADIIKISEEETSFLTQGEDPFDDAVVRKLFHPNLKLLLVTEGPYGCRYYTKEFNGRVDGLKVDAVDTTGAGDAFNEVRLREALKFANACGALTLTERGAIPALPSREAVLNALLKP
ncbi:Carbohydrate kinase PfkB, partial [Dillenia turbinata]